MYPTRLIIGLGNPGAQYAPTRHNVGFWTVDALAQRHGIELRTRRYHSRVGVGTIAGVVVALAQPQTYMNLSGQAVVGLRQWYKIDPATELLVVYDDVDLPFGVLRLRERGSAGTHNGMRSIIALLGSQIFPRLRIGIDRPPPAWDLANYVLGRFTPEQEAQLPDIIQKAADALDLVVHDGMVVAMNQINAPPPKPKREQKRPSETPDPSSDTNTSAASDG